MVQRGGGRSMTAQREDSQWTTRRGVTCVAACEADMDRDCRQLSMFLKIVLGKNMEKPDKGYGTGH
jgi:hypothetical protein